MRRKEKEIFNKSEIEALLKSIEAGHLGTTGENGYPVIKPVNFVYSDEKENRVIYIHSAKEGEKIRDILRDNRVCFEADMPLGFRKSSSDACRAGYLYKSVIARGTAHILRKNSKKAEILNKIMLKYQPEGGYAEIAENDTENVAIIAIRIEEITGKESLG